MLHLCFVKNEVGLSVTDGEFDMTAPKGNFPKQKKTD